ncbi:MAG: NADPH:quinone oxidoreductase [Candidatus Saccharibacteria bacterium]|nr:NADPH:quinone oxidoreductase [Candidatus Saccharibacteria bacterium]
MKAVQITKYGGQDAMQVNDSVERPTAVEGQVIIEVYAAAVNPFDAKVREGLVGDKFKLNFPAILGGDAAGVVAEIGEGVTGFEIGQEVYGAANALGGHGSFAEYTTVVAGQLASKPKSVDFVTAAALPLVGASAYQALVETMALQAGQKILIHGGAGGIGSVAIQIAKAIGAYVATTAASKDLDFVKSLGADEVVDYTSQDFSEIFKDYDAVFDTVGGETNSKSYQVLESGGTLVSMVAPANDALVAQYGIIYSTQSSRATTERLTNIAELVDAGKLTIHIDTVFPFDQAAEALEYLKTGHPRGKVVIQVK